MGGQLSPPLVTAFAIVKAPPAWESGYLGEGARLDGLGLDEYGELVPTLSRRRKASHCPQTIHFPLTPTSCGAGAALFREEPLALSAASRCSQPRSWPSQKGEAVVLGCVWVSCRGWEGVCGTAKTSFSDLEGWVTGAVCMLLAGPLPSGVTHSCEHVAARRAAACHAWLGCGQAGSLRGERCCPPPAHWGLRGRRWRAQGVSGRNPL